MTDKEILADIEKIKYLYKIKEVIRFNHKRHEKVRTESDAEHMIGMQILMQHFLPLEDPDGNMDHKKIYDLILFHDFGEIETGDIIVFDKTDSDYMRESELIKGVIAKSPKTFLDLFESSFADFQFQKSMESKFVKAIDKMEPSFQIFDENGSIICRESNVTKQMHLDVKLPYVENFPVIEKYLRVMSDEMERQGIFVTEEK